MWTYNYNNELYHYGVMGMKWGVRRSAKQLALAAKGRRDTALSKTSDKKQRKAINKAYKSEMKKIKLNKRTKLAELEASRPAGQRIAKKMLKGAFGTALLGGAAVGGAVTLYKAGHVGELWDMTKSIADLAETLSK